MHVGPPSLSLSLSPPLSLSEVAALQKSAGAIVVSLQTIVLNLNDSGWSEDSAYRCWQHLISLAFLACQSEPLLCIQCAW